jgi:hypothetical protein
MDRRYNQPSRPQQYSNPWNDEDYRSEYYEDPLKRSLERERQLAYEREQEERYREEEARVREEEEERKKGTKGREKESMSSWLQRAAGSTQAQFAATAIVSGAVVAGAIFGYQAVQRRERVKDLKSGIPDVGRGHVVEKVSEAILEASGNWQMKVLRYDTIANGRSEAHRIRRCDTLKQRRREKRRASKEGTERGL